MTKEIKLTQGRVALVDDDDYEYLSQWKWFLSSSNSRAYAVRKSRIQEVELEPHSHVFMHKILLKCPNNAVVDHKDGNKLNNQKHNLRICTHKQNARNSTKPISNKSGYKGVFYYESRNKYHSRIKVNGRSIHLGYFTDATLAARAYDNAAKKYFGDFARLNFE